MLDYLQNLDQRSLLQETASDKWLWYRAHCYMQVTAIFPGKYEFLQQFNLSFFLGRISLAVQNRHLVVSYGEVAWPMWDSHPEMTTTQLDFCRIVANRTVTVISVTKNHSISLPTVYPTLFLSCFTCILIITPNK